MKKNEYVSPEVEIVEMTESYTILAGSNEDNFTGEGGNEAPDFDND